MHVLYRGGHDTFTFSQSRRKGGKKEGIKSAFTLVRFPSCTFTQNMFVSFV